MRTQISLVKALKERIKKPRDRHGQKAGDLGTGMRACRNLNYSDPYINSTRV
jgi:hypothetical protein